VTTHYHIFLQSEVSLWQFEVKLTR